MAKMIVAPVPKPLENKGFPKASTDVAPRRRRERGAARYGRMNNFVGYFLVALVVLSAIPVASNRPSWWLLWTMVLGVVGVLYVLRAQFLMGQRRRFQSSQFPLFFALAFLVPVYALVQFLPIAEILPAGLLTLPATVPAELAPHSISVMPDASFLGAIRAIGFILFLMLAIEVGTQSDRNHSLGFWLMIGILAHGLFGMISLKFLDDFSLWGIKDSYIGVLTGTFVNRNSIATFLGFGLILAVSFALDRGRMAALVPKDRGYSAMFTPIRIEIISFWLIAILLAFAIILTQSRMGAFATVAGAYATFLTSRLVSKAPFGKIIFESAVGLVILSVFLIPSAGTGIVERAIFALVESTDRLAIYSQTWAMILDRPVTGFGYDAFAPAFELYRSAPLVAENYIDLAHNSYLALWSEQGLFIGSIPMLLIAWALWITVQRVKASQGDLALNTAAIGMIVLGAVHSTADFSLEIPANIYCFLFVVGLAMSPPRNSSQITADKALKS